MKYDVLILIQIRYIWSLELAYDVRKLAGKSHVVNVYEMFILLDEKLAVLVDSELDLLTFALLEEFKYLLLTKDLIGDWVVSLLQEEFESLAGENGANIEVLLIRALLQQPILDHK